jgi:hypothetical protein
MDGCIIDSMSISIIRWFLFFLERYSIMSPYPPEIG